MSIRSFFSYGSLFSGACILSLLGCAADSAEGPSAARDDALAPANESELWAETFLGHWSGSIKDAGDFHSLDLKQDARYEASVAVCPPAPSGGVGCLGLPRTETGSFRLLGSGGRKTLRLVPDGASVRRYTMSSAPSIEGVRAIELTRSGRTQVLNQSDPNPGEPCGAVRCGAGTVCCNPLLSICTAPDEFCAQ